MSTDASAALPNGIKKAPHEDPKLHEAPCSICGTPRGIYGSEAKPLCFDHRYRHSEGDEMKAASSVEATWNRLNDQDRFRILHRAEPAMSMDSLTKLSKREWSTFSPNMQGRLRDALEAGQADGHHMQAANTPKPLRPEPKLQSALDPSKKDAFVVWQHLTPEDRFRVMRRADPTWSESEIKKLIGHNWHQFIPGIQSKIKSAIEAGQADGMYASAASDMPDRAWENNVSPKYKKAIDTSNAAQRVFDKVQQDYRSRKIGDAEYLAARKIWEAAKKVFDLAYAEEEKRGPPQPEAKPKKNIQPELFKADPDKPQLRDAPKLSAETLKAGQPRGPFTAVRGVNSGFVKDGAGRTIYSSNSYVVAAMVAAKINKNPEQVIQILEEAASKNGDRAFPDGDGSMKAALPGADVKDWTVEYRRKSKRGSFHTQPLSHDEAVAAEKKLRADPDVLDATAMKADVIPGTEEKLQAGYSDQQRAKKLWRKGNIDGYAYTAQVFDEPSSYGINSGRISRLEITAKGETPQGLHNAIYNFDRGLDFDRTPKGLLQKVVATLERLPKVLADEMKAARKDDQDASVAKDRARGEGPGQERDYGATKDQIKKWEDEAASSGAYNQPIRPAPNLNAAVNPHGTESYKGFLIVQGPSGWTVFNSEHERIGQFPSTVAAKAKVDEIVSLWDKATGGMKAATSDQTCTVCDAPLSEIDKAVGHDKCSKCDEPSSDYDD